MLLKKQKAIELRKNGLSYSEILNEIPVAKSTLSLWLRNVGLSKKQSQRLMEKKKLSAMKGALSRKNQRINTTREIIRKSSKQIGLITKRELWLIGTVLYWCEGTKEKDYRPGSGTQFTNSDPNMIKLFIKWLIEIVKIDKQRLKFEIFIHETKKLDEDKIKDYWSDITRFEKNHFSRVYYKKNQIKTNRKNISENYFGVLKIKISASSELNRKITGWTKGIIENYWGIV